MRRGKMRIYYVSGEKKTNICQAQILDRFIVFNNLYLLMKKVIYCLTLQIDVFKLTEREQKSF